MGGHHGNAHAERSCEDSFAVSDLELRDFVPDAFGAVPCNLEVCTRHNHAEHVVGVAARDVFATDVARQALSQFPEELFHGMAALCVLHGRDSVGVKHHDADGRLVALSCGDFAVERFFHITSVEESGQHVADAMLFETHAQVLIGNVQTKRGRDDADLGLPVFLCLGFGKFIDLDGENAEVFFESFDGSADGNTLRAVVQVGATAGDFGRAVVGHDDVAGIEARAFGWHDGFITDDVRTKAENLREFSLDTAVHIKYTGRIGEKFRQKFLHGVDDFGERTVANNGEFEGVPGFERESDLESGGVELSDGDGHGLFDGFGGGNGSRREFGFLFFLRANRHELRDFRLRPVQRFVKVVFNSFYLSAADGVEHKAKHRSPGTDKDEFRPGGHSFFGDDIRSNNAHQKGDQPKDIFYDIHTINNIKIIWGMAVKIF